MKRYGLVFANGEFIEGPAVQAALVPPTDAEVLIVAADGGLRHIRALGLIPDLLVGDMDSLTAAEVQAAERDGAEVHRYSPHKDETDLELALIVTAARGCDDISVFGVLGGRFDHALSNVYLLALPELRGKQVRLIDDDQVIQLWQAGTHQMSGKRGDLVSLIPMSGEATGVVTSDLEYPLRDETLYFGPARGVSNVMLGERATVKFSGGSLLMVQTQL